MKDIKKHVKQVIETIEQGYKYCSECGQIEPIDTEHEVCPECESSDFQAASGFDYLQDALDIEYIVASDRKTLLGARVLVAFGGPNIWINTRSEQVEGYWWQDKHIESYDVDSIGLNEALEQLWGC